MLFFLFFVQPQLIFSIFAKENEERNRGYDLCQQFDSLTQTHDEGFYGYSAFLFKVELENDATIDGSCFTSLLAKTSTKISDFAKDEIIRNSVHFVYNQPAGVEKSKITLTLKLLESTPYSYFVVGDNIELKIEGEKASLQYLDVSRAVIPSSIQSIGIHTFDICKLLSKISIPTSVTNS